VGFVVDVDQQVNADLRVVQMTPPGSTCSVTIGVGMNPSPPGTLKGMQLVVSDVDGHGGPFNAFIFFDDPDGNSWAVQEEPEAS
jgi:hypothetical protein